VLVLTPDFPPAAGGIQLLLERILHYSDTLTPSVLTLAVPARNAVERYPDDHYQVSRLGLMWLGRAGRIGALNAGGLVHAVRFRPHVVLSGHLVTAPAAIALKKLFRLPFVQYLYGIEIEHRPWLARMAASHADRLIALSSYTAGLLESVGGSTERVLFIPPGVDPPPTRPLLPQRAEPVILTSARINEAYKGHDCMVRALRLVLNNVPSARWVVIGDGPLRSGYENLARTLGVDQSISWLGAVSDADRDAWFARAAVFAMPSRLTAGGGGEGYGIAYLEAAAHALPGVSGNVGGAREAVVHEKTGLLVDPTDHGAVASALTRLLQDTHLARRLGEAGRLRAAHMSWRAAAEQVQQILAETGSSRDQSIRD